jgi:hypothetical protein
VELLSPNAAAKLAAGLLPISLALGAVYDPQQNPYGG